MKKRVHVFRAQRFAATLCAALLSVATPCAAEETPRPSASIVPLHKQLSGMRDEARRIREAAQAAYEKDSAVCRTQLLTASTCFEAANKKRNAAVKQAAALEKKIIQIKKDNRQAVKAEKQANQEAKDRGQASSAERQAVRARIKREKIQLQLDKLRGGHATVDPAPPRPANPLLNKDQP